ncbi:MAG: O-antigen ligase family protein [Terricaulis sp.]
MLLLRYLPETAAFLLFFLISGQIGGAFAIVAEFALVGLLLVTHVRTAIETVLRWWPLLLTALLAVASALWSPVPDVSARYGAQLLFTVFVGVFLARLMPARRWLIVFFLSTFVFCLASIASRRTGISDIGMVLIGLTGSKNAMSHEAQMLFMSAFAVLLLNGVSSRLRLLALAALPVGAGLVVITNSATGALLAVAGVAVLCVLWIGERVTPGLRLLTLAFVAALFVPILMLAPEIGAIRDHFLYETLNKDPTLTGRTLLWARADDLIAHKPFLGYGYQSIWMGDSFETIGLKRLTGIEDGRTFHFHNTFRQVAVDTGLLGLAIFAATLLFTLLAGLMQALMRPNAATSFFFASFALAVATAFTDTILQPFLIQTVIIYSCAVYAFARPEPVAQTAPNTQPISRFAAAARPT